MAYTERAYTERTREHITAERRIYNALNKYMMDEFDTGCEYARDGRYDIAYTDLINEDGTDEIPMQISMHVKTGTIVIDYGGRKKNICCTLNELVEMAESYDFQMWYSLGVDYAPHGYC